VQQIPLASSRGREMAALSSGGWAGLPHDIEFEEVKLSEERTWPVILKVDIEPEELKRVVEEGRLMEFEGAFSALAAGHIKGKIVEQLAEAGVGLTKVGEGISIVIGFDVEDRRLSLAVPWGF